MSLLFIDSFRHYALSNMAQKWNNFGGLSIVNDPEFGVCCQCGPGGGMSRTLALNSTFVIGFRCRLDFGGGFSTGELYNLSTVSLGGGLVQLFRLNVQGDNTLALYANPNVICNPVSFSINDNVSFFVGMEMTLSESAGNIQISANLYVNGELIGTGTALSGAVVSTLVHQSANADFHAFQGTGSGATFIKDLYIANQNGGFNNSFPSIGDVHIDAIFPRQDVMKNWTPSAGTAHYSLINEHQPDDDGTYLYNSLPAPPLGEADAWYFDLINSFVGTIKGAQFLLYARKDNEGSRVFQHVTAGGFAGPQEYLSDHYCYYFIPFDVDPSSNMPFTVGGFNSTAFGINLSA